MATLAINGGPREVNVLPRFWHPQISEHVLDRMEDPAFRDQMASYDGSGVFEELEQTFAQQVGVAHALSTNSGTSALFSMFFAAGLGEDDEVLVPAYTFYASASPLLPLRCEIVLVDALDNGNIDPQDLRRKLSSRTKAIVVTHMWGIPCDMRALVEIASEHRIALLEDASHAHGASYEGRAPGTFGDGAWSLGAKKIVTGGQGGMYATASRERYERALLLGHSNNRAYKEVVTPAFQPYRGSGLGFNLRMHPFSAVLIRDQLERLAQTMREKREVAALIARELAGMPFLRQPRVPSGAQQSWYAFPLLFDEDAAGVSRELFVEALLAEGALEFDIPRSTCPLTEFAIFQGDPGGLLSGRDGWPRWRYARGAFAGAESFHRKVLKLTVWYGPERVALASAHLRALHKVAENLDELRQRPRRLVHATA